MKKPIYITLSVLLLTCFWLWVNRCLAFAPKVNSLSVRQDQQKAERLVKKLHASEVLGPLAPVALSPFFGLACLSGTSILCNNGVLPENDFLIGNEVLNNGYIFLVFAILTVITSVPKLVTASKVFAEITDRLETYAGIISYVVILLLADLGQSPEQEAVVYSAGIFTLTHHGLLACAAAVNIFVISTVKFFFELLVLISPIPTLDAIFEFANKTIAGVLVLIYAFNPWVAFVLNVILFLFCLLIFKWVNRRIGYLRALLLDPVVSAIKRKLFKRKDLNPDLKAKKRMARHIPDVDLLLKCFPTRRFGRIKKKDLCYLVFAGDSLSLVKLRFLRPPVIRALNRNQVLGNVKEGLMSYSLELTDESKSFELVFGRAYKHNLEAVKSKLEGLKRKLE